jgi:hypothetical protein
MKRSVVLALLALLALLLAGCGGCGGNAGGGGGGGGQGPNERPNDPFYGVISAEPLPGSEELARMGDGGVGTLRVNLAWGSVQPAPQAPYDWSTYDLLIAGAAVKGMRVLATVYGSASWAEPTPEHPPLGSALPAFARFVRAAVRRYGVGGSFWSEHPTIPRRPIVDWQLWNEPNFGLFWKPAPSVSGYLRLLRTFHGAVKGAAAGGHVLLAGLFPTPGGGIFMRDFITELYRRGGGGLFDAAAIHPYAANPARAIALTAELRSLLDREGDPNKPIWITEVGWASGGAPSGLTVGPARQADYLTQIFRLARAERDRVGIAGVVWYSLTDTPGPLWVGHCGLFRLDGSAKPAWRAFVSAAGGRA